MDMFYKNLDQQNVYQVQDKFASKEEFDEYRRKFKLFKRELEDEFKEREGNYQFRNNHYHFQQRDSGNPFLEESAKNFKRKDSHQSYGSGQMVPTREPVQPEKAKAPANNLLPVEYGHEDEEIDFFMDEEEVERKVEKYKEEQY